MPRPPACSLTPFPARFRYTGISVSYALASTLFGGTTPIVGQALLTATGSIVPVACYGAVMIVVSLVGVRALIARTRRHAIPEDPNSPVTASLGEENAGNR